MPFRKRRHRSHKRPSAMRIAKKALHGVNFIKKSMELKHVTYDITALSVSDVGFISQNLNLTIAGTFDTTRIGDKIFVTSSHIGFNFVRGAEDCTVRVICFWDKQNKILVPDDLIDSIGTDLAVLSDYHVDQRKQWIKVFDRSFTLTDIHKNKIQWVRRHKIRKATQFSQGTSSIDTGRLAVMFITDLRVGLPIADYPEIRAFSRTYYNDL